MRKIIFARKNFENEEDSVTVENADEDHQNFLQRIDACSNCWKKSKLKNLCIFGCVLIVIILCLMGLVFLLKDERHRLVLKLLRKARTKILSTVSI